MIKDRVMTAEEIATLGLDDKDMINEVEVSSLSILNIDTVDSTTYLEVNILFKMDNEIHLLDKHMDWYPVIYVNDPKVHEEESSKRTMRFIPIPGSTNSELVFDGPEMTDPYKTGFSSGSGMVTKLDDGSYQFHEFFTKTPVTLAVLAELYKMKEDPTYSLWSVPEYYFSNLLDTLAMYWD